MGGGGYVGHEEPKNGVHWRCGAWALREAGGCPGASEAGGGPPAVRRRHSVEQLLCSGVRLSVRRERRRKPKDADKGLMCHEMTAMFLTVAASNFLPSSQPSYTKMILLRGQP